MPYSAGSPVICGRLLGRAAVVGEHTAGLGGGCNCRARPALKGSMSLLMSLNTSFLPVNLNLTPEQSPAIGLSEASLHLLGSQDIHCFGLVLVYNSRFSSESTLVDSSPTSPTELAPRPVHDGSEPAILVPIFPGLTLLPFSRLVLVSPDRSGSMMQLAVSRATTYKSTGSAMNTQDDSGTRIAEYSKGPPALAENCDYPVSSKVSANF